MDAGAILLLLFLVLVVLVVVDLMRIRQLSVEIKRVGADVDVLRSSVLAYSQICRDIASADVVTSAPVVDAPTDDLQTLLENPLVQQVLESR